MLPDFLFCCHRVSSFFGLATNTLNVRSNKLHGTNIDSRTILVTMYYCG